jgi:Ca2+-binding EF-hand superfamily protein
MRITLLVAAAAATALMAGAAMAQPTPPTPEERAAAFTKADANKDGKLDKAEFKTTLPEQFQDRADMAFERRDADKDGFISQAEFSAPGGRRGGGAPPAQ